MDEDYNTDNHVVEYEYMEGIKPSVSQNAPQDLNTKKVSRLDYVDDKIEGKSKFSYEISWKQIKNIKWFLAKINFS